MSTQQGNTTGSNDQNNNETGNEVSSVFISQVEFDRMIQQVQKDVKSRTNMKIINKFASHLPKKAIKKMNKWLASSHSTLGSNKVVKMYKLNTMLDKDTAAQGVTQSINVADNEPYGFITVKSHADGFALALDYPTNTVNNAENIGFPIVEQKINELLTERLTDSVGKQSPTSGKVYDLRSIINANTLPVYKNGSVAYMHRILETLLYCYAYCSNYNSRTTAQKAYEHGVYVNVYGPGDLESYQARQNLESRQKIGNFSLVSKAVNSGDLSVDILRWACSTALLQLDNSAKYVVGGVDSNSYLHVYSQVTPNVQLPAYYITNDATYSKDGYFSFPAVWLASTPTSSNTAFYYYENRMWYKVTATHAAVYNYFASGDHNSSVLKENGSIRIDETNCSWTSNTIISLQNPHMSDWYGYRPLKYTVMENVQDIINAIYILAYLTCTISWKANSSSSVVRKTLGWTVLNSNRSREALRLTTCSIYARIAQVYGQFKYADDVEFALPTENELGNKIHNLGYYIAGLYAKDASLRYGSIDLIETYMPQIVKTCWIQGIRTVPYDVGEKEIQVPLHYFIDKSDTSYNSAESQDLAVSDFYTETAGQISYTEYFTEAGWWRYDYFGGYEVLAPKQELCANTDNRKFNETAESVFMNTNSTKGSALVTGQAMIRWLPDGNYQAVDFAVRSFCQNTAVKFKIPSIYKNKDFVSALKLHGLDVIGTGHTDPVWYAPYNAEAELVDDGSFDQKMLDALFD